MISFRYHLVSLAAVLFALAAGVALGAGPLSDNVRDAFGNGSGISASDVTQLQDRIERLREQVTHDDDVIADLTPPVVAARLKGHRVLLVVTPGADAALADSIATSVIAAGGQVSGRITLLPAYVDPANATFVGELAAQLDVQSDEIAGGPYVASAVVLSDALLTKGEAVGTADPAQAAIVPGFVQADLITVQGDVQRRSDLVAVVTPRRSADADNDLLTLKPLFQSMAAAAQGVIVTGPAGSAEDVGGGMVSLVREDTDLRRAVSSDDTVDTAAGQLETTLALAERLANRGGHYGSGPGASDTLPNPPPRG